MATNGWPFGLAVADFVNKVRSADETRCQKQAIRTTTLLGFVFEEDFQLGTYVNRNAMLIGPNRRSDNRRFRLAEH